MRGAANWTEAEAAERTSIFTGAPVKAKGRIREIGYANKTEADFGAHLATEQRIGAILWWRYGAVKLRISDNCFITVDFFAMEEDGVLTAIDTKGAKKMKRVNGEVYGKPYIKEDARIKLRAIAEMYPFRVKAAYFYEGTWQVEDF